MLKYLASIILLLLIGCAKDTRRLYPEIAEVKLDSTYVYGNVVVGSAFELEMVLTNKQDGKSLTYSKLWAKNGIYKEHIFTFNLTEGLWELSGVMISKGSSVQKLNGGSFYVGGGGEIKKDFLVKNGIGNFIGKFDALNNPINGLMADSNTKINEKHVVDEYMKNNYPTFKSERTQIVVFNK